MEDRIGNRLSKLRKEFEAMNQTAEDFTERQMSETAKIWLQSEATFHKQIAKPLDGQPPDKLPVYPGEVSYRFC